MSLADSMTEQELSDFFSIYKTVYGKDVKIDINGEDIAIAPNGDVDVTGVVVGRELGELKDLVIQTCLTVILTEYDEPTGGTNPPPRLPQEGMRGSLRLEDLIGLYNSTQIKEYIQLMKAIIIEKATRLDFVESVTKIDHEINGDTVSFNIEIQIITGETLENIRINLGVA